MCCKFCCYTWSNLALLEYRIGVAVILLCSALCRVVFKWLYMYVHRKNVIFEWFVTYTISCKPIRKEVPVCFSPPPGFVNLRWFSIFFTAHYWWWLLHDSTGVWVFDWGVVEVDSAHFGHFLQLKFIDRFAAHPDYILAPVHDNIVGLWRPKLFSVCLCQPKKT